jgi:hypothetical protein
LTGKTWPYVTSGEKAAKKAQEDKDKKWVPFQRLKGSKYNFTFYTNTREVLCVGFLYHSMSMWCIIHLLCPPLKKGGHIALLLPVGRCVGPPAVSVHFLCTGCTYWNATWYIVWIVKISRSSSVFDKIEPFSTVMPLGLQKLPIICCFYSCPK